jgi:hypothetical protein
MIFEQVYKCNFHYKNYWQLQIPVRQFKLEGEETEAM